MDYRALVVLIVKTAGLILVRYTVALLLDRVAGYAAGTDLERLVQPLIFSGIGLFLALDGVRALAYYFALDAYLQDAYSQQTLEDPSARADVASNIVSVVIGIALIFGARGLSALVHRLRYGAP